MEPDEDLSLIKDIIIDKVETLTKYKSRFKNKIVLMEIDLKIQELYFFIFKIKEMKFTLNLEFILKT